MTTEHVYQAPPCGGRSKQQAPPSDCVSGYVVKRGQEYNRGQEGVRHLATVLVDKSRGRGLT